MCNTNTIQEPSREIAVSGKFDVIVIGGGIAGVAAAVAAARNSVRVCLIERYCGLGGLATLGNVTMWLPLCDGMGNQVIAGLGEELLKLSVADLKQDNPSAQFRGVPACWQPGGNRQERTQMRYQADFNPAAYMLAIEELVVKDGVKLLYDTRFCSVRREGMRVSHVIVENKGGRSALACGVIVDTTGDADVCVAAGESTLSLESNVPAGWFYTFRAGELKLHHLSNAYCPVASIEGGQAPFFFPPLLSLSRRRSPERSESETRRTLSPGAAKHARGVQGLVPGGWGASGETSSCCLSLNSTRELSPLSLLAAAIAPPLPAAALAPFYVPLALIERLRDTLPRASANAKGAARICARRWECENSSNAEGAPSFFSSLMLLLAQPSFAFFRSSSLTHTGAEPPHQPTNHAGHHLDRR